MKKEKGFTLIELVIVIVILGILAATGLSKFMDVTEEAKNASVEGTASGFAAGVMMVRGQWEAKGRPQTYSVNTTFYDGTWLQLTTPTRDQREQGPDARLPDGGRKAHPEVRKHLGNSCRRTLRELLPQHLVRHAAERPEGLH